MTTRLIPSSSGLPGFFGHRAGRSAGPLAKIRRDSVFLAFLIAQPKAVLPFPRFSPLDYAGRKCGAA